ncbi:hypothetical protein GCM10027037_01540 [Mucilaginibacter koreensis]
MITVQHRHTFKLKEIAVNEWLSLSADELKQWYILSISNIVRVDYNYRPLGLFEETVAISMAEQNPKCYSITELGHIDEIQLRHHVKFQRLHERLKTFGKKIGSTKRLINS